MAGPIPSWHPRPRQFTNRIWATGRILCAGLAALTITGCVHQPLMDLASRESTLQTWIDAELAPYLVQQVGEHPRFKGEPVILVQLKGHDVQPSIDGLTRSVRDQLTDRLISSPGVTLSWEPQEQPLHHHRHLDRVQCKRVRDASYYIGIEISRGSNADHRVSVRALDVRAGEWVSGFGKYWTGRLTNGEANALQTSQVDESLRGLRVLPFSDTNPDLAAAYLANNLSCLLRQRDRDDLTIHVDSLPSEQSHLSSLLPLISHNLSRYREVSVTDRKAEADYLLRGEAYEVHSGLHQVWVLLQPRGSGERMSGMDTATWVKTGIGTEIQRPQAVFEPMDRRLPRIASFHLLEGTSLDPRCSNTPLDRDSRVACRAMAVTAEHADRVFVFLHDTKDGVSLLSSARCRDRRVQATGITRTKHYSFPTRRFANSGWVTAYAVAVRGDDRAEAFETHLMQLPDACGAKPGLRSEVALDAWLHDLDRLVSGSGEHLAWAARRLP